MLFQIFRCTELHLANRLIEKTIFEHVQLIKYTSESITLRYGTLGPSNSSSFLQRRNEPFFNSRDLTTIR